MFSTGDTGAGEADHDTAVAGDAPACEVEIAAGVDPPLNPSRVSRPSKAKDASAKPERRR